MTAAFADGFSLYFRHPQTVEIAVGIYCNGLVAADAEGNVRRVAGFERLALTAVLRFHINPFDKVLGKHRMVCTAYVDGYNAVCNGNDRKMLLPACINRIGNEGLHFLTAAENGNAYVMDHFNEIAAAAADVKFCVHILVPPVKNTVVKATVQDRAKTDPERFLFKL